MKNLKVVNIRAIAIIIVVLGHSIILYSPHWGIYQTSNKVYIFEVLKDIINIIQMPLFFSLSGYLFYKTISKKQMLFNFVKTKFKRLIIPFIAIALFWMIPIKCFLNYPNYVNKSFLEILQLLFSLSDSGHLWYLPTLFFIFIIMFVVCKILKIKEQNYKYGLIFLLFLILFVVSSKIYINLYINNIFSYLIYFYLGFLVCKYEDNLIKINKIAIIFITIILIILSLIFNNIYLNLGTAILTVLMFNIVMPSKTNKIIDKISTNSFGIYLLHSPLIYITYTYLSNANPLLVVFINFVCFGLLAFGLTELLRKTPLKIFIGG